MDRLARLKAEMAQAPAGGADVRPYCQYLGYCEHLDDPVPLARAWAIESLFTRHEKRVYQNDLVAGSLLGARSDDPALTAPLLERAQSLVASYGANTFLTNADHFAPDYETFLAEGVGGTLRRIERSLLAHRADPDAEKKRVFLTAAQISMRAFGAMVRAYGEAAGSMAALAAGEARENFEEMARICKKVASEPPATFREALQLVWLAHLAFVYEGRYAMALGRLDQFLHPFYRRDIESGALTRAAALELVECTLCKIGERRRLGGDDVVNIAIGGLKPDGTGGVNELSYVILEAVGRANIPGPNLSARLYEGVPDGFLDACLRVIGTGLGYPALMNDEVNIPALHRYGYTLEDSRNYCMVGCIENFMQGKQPPWSDGRYNSPKYLELALNDGRCMLTDIPMGPQTGDASEFAAMDQLMAALRLQMEHGAAEYMARFRNENDRYNRVAYAQPFLSCFCQCCIERGLDINCGGALYPSAHGAGCMGIGTMADSLAAIEEVVYRQGAASLSELRDALRANFEGHEALRAKLRKAPKYGNDHDLPDKYAIWFVEAHDELFSKYRTPDGGAIYTAIASNVANISAGRELAASPDGRLRGEPVSDAASPSRGADQCGPTALLLSMAKPDYRKVACGTVLNQKYSPAMFTDPRRRARLLSLIKVYFGKGGQEIQINALSRQTLMDARRNPEAHRDLIVRVSGFSAYFADLDARVQDDILARTEHA